MKIDQKKPKYQQPEGEELKAELPFAARLQDSWVYILISLSFFATSCLCLYILYVFFLDDEIFLSQPMMFLIHWGCIATCLISGFVAWVGLKKKWQAMRYRFWRSATSHSHYYADYPWQPKGQAHSAMNAYLHRLYQVLLVLFVIWPIYHFTFVYQFAHPQLVLLMYVAFGLACLVFFLVLVYVVQQLILIIQVGSVVCRYDQFPYYLGGQLEAAIVFKGSAHMISQVDLKLRQMMLFNQVIQYSSHEQVDPHLLLQWQEEIEIKAAASILKDQRKLPFRFSLPADKPSTAMQATHPVYWELVVRVHCGKLGSTDIHFLMPVYEKRVGAEVK